MRPKASGLRRAVVLAGPTGVGKSAVALQLAARLDAEIISVDSMQVYRGMDIGAAKPTAEEQLRVRHHLIDVVEVSQPFDASEFVRLASAAATEIIQKNRTPLFCGGTGLYFKAYFEGLGTAPPTSPELRRQLEETPMAELLNELQAGDPATFDRIDRNNPRRVIRAVAVLRLSGRPFSEQRADWRKESERGAGPKAVFFGLMREETDLKSRIDHRVDAMFQAGLVEEVKSLADRGLRENPTAALALGYRQVLEHLAGGRSLAATAETVKLKTRQYAKRQMTWFRGQPGLEWIAVEPGAPAEEIADRLHRRYLERLHGSSCD